MQGASAYAQQLRRLGAVAPGLEQRLVQQTLFIVLDRKRGSGQGEPDIAGRRIPAREMADGCQARARARAAIARIEIVFGQFAPAVEHNGVFTKIPQLANVSRPAIRA